MPINDKGLALLKSFEGCALQAYPDKKGRWAIGYGSTRDTYPGLKITIEDADDRLIGDLRSVELMVNGLVHVPLNSNQLSALLCFVYNVGVGQFASSILLKLLNNKEYDLASLEFPRWDKETGITAPGLLRRRIAEQTLFNDPNCSDIPADN